MDNLKKIEFGEIAELRKERFNPETSNETKPCLELEHFEQVTGKINGYVPSSEQKSIKNVFYKGDVLFGKLRPYLRKYWLAEFDGVCSSEVWVLKPKSKNISNEYIFNLIQTNNFIQAANVSSGSKMPRADWDYIINFPFYIINSKPEQKAIAQVLSTADAAIHRTEKLIAQKELRKKWLMQQLLTGKKRLKGFDGEWKSQKVSKLFNPVDRYVEWNENELYNLISIRRRNGGVFSREPLFGHQIGVKKLKQVAIDDFVISKRQVSHGAWAVIDQNFIGAKISDEYDSLTITKQNLLHADFWKWYCQIPVLTHFANVDSDGVHIEKSIFDYNLFKRRYVFIPSSTKEQTAIAQVLQAADKEISLLKAKAEKLREQKKGVMQVLLTGKKRLNQDFKD